MESDTQQRKLQAQGSDSAAETKGDKKGKLDDFLQLMQPRSQGKVWDNDDTAPMDLNASTAKGNTGKISDNEGGDSDGESSDDDDYQEMPATRGAAFKGRSATIAAISIRMLLMGS